MRRSTLALATLTLPAVATLVVPASVEAQRVFHSTQSANLHTAEMLRPGNWLFEISHRFFPPVSEGADALWGVDGSAFIRLGLTYQASERLMLSLVRTNLDDNLGLDARVAIGSTDVGGTLVKLAAAGGVAVNTDVNEVSNPAQDQLREDNEVQLYVQLLVNALLGESFAVGVAPSYLRNPRLLDLESENTVSLGLHAQGYMSDAVSLFGEWIISESIPGQENDSGTLGVQFETRGHFFKLLVTNQTRPNPTQYLGGSPHPFELDELRFGFNITRLLPF
ncbi:MAG: hypothetical protein HKO77_03785 [Gemmatimonadetes bacterium]|nr:hypothetical protein [Gemmatimonadota bacterium]